MSPSRTDEILEAWRATADGVVLRKEPPRPGRGLKGRTSAFGFAGTAAAVIVVLAALWFGGRVPAEGAGGSTAAVGSTPSAQIPTQVAIGPSGLASPSSNPSASLPNPGGTCSASQLVLGSTTAGFTFSAAYYRHAYFTQLLRNAGSPCVVRVPKAIGVASTTGPLQIVSVNDSGNEVCVGNACHDVTPPTYEIRSGQMLEIDFSVSWWVGANDVNGKPLFTAPPCVGAVSDVTRVDFPVASGVVAIDLDTAVQEAGSSVPWHEVCSSPMSISFEIKPR